MTDPSRRSSPERPLSPVGGPRRILLAAFGDPGHAFPAIALGRTLAARGHRVWLQTWSKWREHVEREGMEFAPAPEYQVFPTLERPLKPYAAAVRAARETRPLIQAVNPDAVVVDILTVAAALAAELEGRRWATLIPHVMPTSARGFPPYSSGARLPRTSLGRALWRSLAPLTSAGEQRGRDELNAARAQLGLPPLAHVHGGISGELAIVATFPQLEYPRVEWNPAVEITGPLLWEQPHGETELPPGDDPLVLIAPSTAQDPQQRMLAAALAGLGGERLRVLATTNRRTPAALIAVPANARVVSWLSYAKTMPHCAAVVCHAGHGTLVRALACGVPVLACPAGGDMAENAARAGWAGAGVRLSRRLVGPRAIRLALQRLLADERYARQAGELAAWAAANNGAERAANAVERFCATREPGEGPRVGRE